MKRQLDIMINRLKMLDIFKKRLYSYLILLDKANKFRLKIN